MASILSRADPELRRFVSFASLIVSTAIALHFELYLILVLWLLTLPGIFSTKEKRFAVSMQPITTQACVWLTTGYIATIAFYAAIISVFLR